MNILVILTIILLVYLISDNTIDYFSDTYENLYNNVSSSQTPGELKTNLDNLYKLCDTSTQSSCESNIDNLKNQMINNISYGLYQFGRFPDKNMSLL
jgi:hypothetical protein